MRIALVALCLMFVAGCGNGDDGPKSDPISTTQPETNPKQPGSEFLTPIPEKQAEAMPKCADVWGVGKTLPADYKGCQIDGGGIDRGAKYACTDGRGDLIGYNEELFARLGGPIRAYGEDETEFSNELFEACKPEQ